MKDNFSYECPAAMGPIINLANCLLDLRRCDEALTFYKRALRLFEREKSMQPNLENISFLYNMSVAAEMCRFYKEAAAITK